MKRSSPLRRTGSLQRKAALVTRTALKRGKVLRSKPKPQISPRERKAMDVFHRAAVRRSCVVCGKNRAQAFAAGTKLQAHHGVPQEKLKQVCQSRRLDPVAILWDPRNAVPICESHSDGQPSHTSHTTAKNRLPLKALPRSVVEFARELGLVYVLDRYYAV